MQSIWRRTAYLFWQYPALWLPVLCADFLKFWFGRLTEFIANHIFLWLMPRASVFSQRPSQASESWTSLLIARSASAPITLGSKFLEIAFYVTAFFMTATMVRMALEGRQPRFTETLATAKSTLPVTLTLALRVLITAGAVYSLMLAGVYTLGRFGLLQNNPYVLYSSAIYLCTTAILIAPKAIEIVRSEQLGRTTSHHKRAARIVAALAVLLSNLIAFITPWIEGPIYRDLGAHIPFLDSLLEITSSLLAALPYIPLFIALSLLACNPPDSDPVAWPVPGSESELHNSEPSSAKTTEEISPGPTDISGLG